MIPQAYILEWYQQAPWQDFFMVEQDLVVERALISIFKDPYLNNKLAFRGGTALHKLFLTQQARYSEDIDLVQLHSESIRETTDHLRQALAFLDEPAYRTSQHNVKLIYHFETEFQPMTRLRLKIETNTREHGSYLPLQTIRHTLQNRWFSDSADIRTFDLHELLATKLRALYQRKKGRDLFDLYLACQRLDPDISEITRLFHQYTEQNPVTGPQFSRNLNEKLKSAAFLTDMTGLLRTGVPWNVQDAADWLFDTVIPLI